MVWFFYLRSSSEYPDYRTLQRDAFSQVAGFMVDPAAFIGAIQAHACRVFVPVTFNPVARCWRVVDPRVHPVAVFAFNCLHVVPLDRARINRAVVVSSSIQARSVLLQNLRNGLSRTSFHRGSRRTKHLSGRCP